MSELCTASKAWGARVPYTECRPVCANYAGAYSRIQGPEGRSTAAAALRQLHGPVGKHISSRPVCCTERSDHFAKPNGYARRATANSQRPLALYAAGRKSGTRRAVKRPRAPPLHVPAVTNSVVVSSQCRVSVASRMFQMEYVAQVVRPQLGLF